MPTEKDVTDRVAAAGHRSHLRRNAAGSKHWRVDLRWYALSLLTIPLLMLAVLWPFSLIAEPAFAPRFNWPLFAIGLLAGTFEEVGWTGFASQHLLARQRSILAGPHDPFAAVSLIHADREGQSMARQVRLRHQRRPGRDGLNRSAKGSARAFKTR